MYEEALAAIKTDVLQRLHLLDSHQDVKWKMDVDTIEIGVGNAHDGIILVHASWFTDNPRAGERATKLYFYNIHTRQKASMEHIIAAIW